MTAPWKPYACVVPAKGVTGTCTVLSTVHHVTHTESALRILADGKITRGLIYDESVLNDSRTTVVWLSPNTWYDGSRYGCVQFTLDFADIVAGRKVYWVEARKYKIDAYRFIISDQDLKKLPVKPYDVTAEEGPLRYVGGVWYWNATQTAEFLLDASILLHQCKKVDFIKHHDMYCAVPGGCDDLKSDGAKAAGRVMAYLLSRGFRVIDRPLTETVPKKALSIAAERGISSICEGLDAESGKLSGPLHAETNVHVVLRAALQQFAVGDVTLAQATANLIGSDVLFRKGLAALVRSHFGLESSTLNV
jgi:hypothetical protein